MSERRAPPADDDGFLARWSRRKAQGRGGHVAAAEPETAPRAPAAPVPAVATAAPAAAIASTAAPEAAADPQAQADAAPAEQSGRPQRPAPTMADVERLTRDSDYAAFASRDVDPQVRNAALKKLFHAEPHFNVMDGLDVYIDDYSKGEPLPRAVMRQMLQARALGLLDDELKEQDKPGPDAALAETSATDASVPEAGAPAAPAANASATDAIAAARAADASATDVSATEAPAAESRRTDEDADLQLQPDDAAGAKAARAGAGDAGG